MSERCAYLRVSDTTERPRDEGGRAASEEHVATVEQEFV
jgi:hypothetical protein